MQLTCRYPDRRIGIEKDTFLAARYLKPSFILYNMTVLKFFVGTLGILGNRQLNLHMSGYRQGAHVVRARLYVYPLYPDTWRTQTRLAML